MRINVPVDEGLRAAVAERARAEDRSLAATVRVLLRAALAGKV